MLASTLIILHIVGVSAFIGASSGDWSPQVTGAGGVWTLPAARALYSDAE